MSDKVLVDKKDIVDIVSVAQKLHYASLYYYQRFANHEEVSIIGNHQTHNPDVGYVYEPSTSGTYKINQWNSKTFDGATRVCADVYYGLNTSGSAYCIVLQGGRPSGTPSSYSAAEYDTIDGYVTHFSMKDSDVSKMQRMLHKQMDCREVPATNMKHFEVEGDTITLGFQSTSSSGYTPPTGYTYREYGVFVVFYDPDSIRQVEDTDTSVDNKKSMDGINNFSDIGYEAQWADAKNYLVNYMPSKFYLNIKNNGTFYGNGGYVDVDVSAPLISTMSAVEITATNATVSNLKERTYDLSSYLTKDDQAFFLRLYVSSASSSSGSSTGYKEWLFSPLFPPLINTSGDKSIVTTSSVSTGYYWITKSTGTSTFSSTASPSITSTSQVYLSNSSPWTNCSWRWNPYNKQLLISNKVTSNYYPSSPKAILYYVKA